MCFRFFSYCVTSSASGARSISWKHQYGTPSLVKNSNAASTFASAVAIGEPASQGKWRVPGPNGSCPALQKVCQ
ncbi:hypothetical protein D3C75_301870 [compost metagenome]